MKTRLALGAFFVALSLVGTAAGADSNPDPRIAVHSDGTGFRCSSTVDLDLVKVSNPSGDAVVLAANCSGRIGRVEVDTRSEDGVKVQNSGTVAHDLTIASGYIKCHAIAPGAHQDGVQAMGGARILFLGVAIDCLGNSNFFVNRAGSGASTPTQIVCDGCRLGGKSSTTLFIASSVSSGARNTVGCEGRNRDFYFSGATTPVNEGNTLVGHDDPSCLSEGSPPPPPPPPDPDPDPPAVCDQACVDNYENQLGQLRGEVARLNALITGALARLADVIDYLS